MTKLDAMLTGEEEIDSRLREAFELGVRHGAAADRDNIQRSARIDQTTRLLIAVMRSQGIDLEKALSDFNIPKKERDTYRRIITKRPTKQKSACVNNR